MVSRSTRRRKRTRRTRRRQRVGGAAEPITDADVLYKDNLVCILRPDVKKGVLVFHEYLFDKAIPAADICKVGLKTAEQLQKEGVITNRVIYHPYIFFRAPYYSGEIDYSSLETEIKSSFGQLPKEKKAFIRVDPDRTYVFSSEIRNIARFSEWYQQEWSLPDGKLQASKKADILVQNSKKTLSEYLRIIGQNLAIEQRRSPGQTVFYNLFSGTAQLFPMTVKPKAPFDYYPIFKHSEILVSIPHLTPDYFALCA